MNYINTTQENFEYLNNDKVNNCIDIINSYRKKHINDMISSIELSPFFHKPFSNIDSEVFFKVNIIFILIKLPFLILFEIMSFPFIFFKALIERLTYKLKENRIKNKYYEIQQNHFKFKNFIELWESIGIHESDIFEIERAKCISECYAVFNKNLKRNNLVLDEIIKSNAELHQNGFKKNIRFVLVETDKILLNKIEQNEI